MTDAERRQQIKRGMQMLVVVPLDELGDESLGGFHAPEELWINHKALHLSRKGCRDGARDLGVLRGSFVQKPLDNEDVSTTMIYMHVLNKEPNGVTSPIDGIEKFGLAVSR